MSNHVNCKNEIDDTTENSTNVDADSHNANDNNSTRVSVENVDRSNTGIDKVVCDNDTKRVAPENCSNDFVTPDDDKSNSGNRNDCEMLTA